MRAGCGVARAACSARASASRAGFVREPPHRDAGDDQLSCANAQRRRQRRRIDVRKHALGRVEPADQEQPADLERNACMRGVERGRRGLEHARAAAVESLPGNARSRETSAISASATTQRARAIASRGRRRGAPAAAAPWRGEIAELRHRDAAQRQRRRVVAQRHPLSVTGGKRPRRAEGITRRQRARRGR
jgi:hypothetical protein